MRNNRYPQDYLPKIAYWYAKCWSISTKAFLCNSERTPEWEYAWRKYIYFSDRQERVYGEMSSDQEYILNDLISDILGDSYIY
jgi:hypothetical protein